MMQKSDNLNDKGGDQHADEIGLNNYSRPLYSSHV